MRAARSAVAIARFHADEQLERAVVGLFKHALPAPPPEWRACWRYYPCDEHCERVCRDHRHGERRVHPLPRYAQVPAQRGAPDRERLPPRTRRRTP